MKLLNADRSFGYFSLLKKCFSKTVFPFTLQLFLVGIGCLGFNTTTFSQVTIELTVIDGSATTPDCGGLFDSGEPTIGFIVENRQEVAYSEEVCPNIPSFPNIQFDTTLACISDLRGGEIQVCLRTYFREFTGFLGTNRCEVPNEGFRCGEVICQNVLLPTTGKDSTYTVVLSEDLGLSSFGYVTFTIAVSEATNGDLIAENDRICHAVNLGQLAPETVLGDKEKGVFNNYCATAISEPSPHQMGVPWQNNVATWFSFTTSNDPNTLVLIEAKSDPEAVDDPVNLQLALYESDNNTCNGNLTLIAENFTGNDFDEYLLLNCLEPNRPYFIMVDGETTTDGLLHGIFGLEVKEVTIQPQTNDAICDAIPLTVSSGGVITEMYSNFCATNTNEPTTGFPISNSVWFQFVPSQSRRVFINVGSDLPYPSGIDPIDPEIAIFYSPTNDCTDPLIEVAHQNSASNSNSEFLSLECLNPKLTYYILVDGSDLDPTGLFSITVAERGYPNPIALDTVICRGDIFELGDKSYANAGTYTDTLITEDECLTIVDVNLTVVEPLELDLRLGELARGEGETGGVMIANAQFGTGDYNFEWSNGQSNQVANGLIGGTEYCLTVTDNNAGCSTDTCFTMEYPVPIDASIQGDFLPCSYDTTGNIEINVTKGKPPYQFQIQGIIDPSFIRSGTIVKNDTSIIIENIPIGVFNVFMQNNESVQNFVAIIDAPLPISIDLIEQVNPACFSGCNGSLQLEVSGGVGDYNFAWNSEGQQQQNLSDVCAGNYILTITDANNCIDSAQFTITEPPAPTVAFMDVQAVICFGETNGQATLTANEPISQILWDNGETTSTATNLPAGMRQVVIIDESGCESTASVEITQPDAPLVATIEEVESIACGGDSNGVLADASTGGNGNYDYTWSNGSKADFIDNLTAGKYTLVVRDEKGCESETIANLEEPTPIEATIRTQDVTCPAGPTSGIILVENSSGGTAPYRYQLNNQNFINNTEIVNLQAGTYTVLLQDDKGCEKRFDNILIKDPPELTVNLGADKQLQLGNSIELKATINRQSTFEWFSTDSLDCLNCPIIDVRPFENTTYTVIATDIETGCVAQDEVVVSVLKARKVFVPNVFSPNGDGFNDELIINGGADVDRILRFEIYARNGSLIFQKENFSLSENIGWDGTFDQQPMGNDVFLYFAEVQFIDGATTTFAGDFTLVK